MSQLPSVCEEERGKNIQAGVGAGKPEESLLPAVGGSRWRGGTHLPEAALTTQHLWLEPRT